MQKEQKLTSSFSKKTLIKLQLVAMRAPEALKW